MPSARETLTALGWEQGSVIPNTPEVRGVLRQLPFGDPAEVTDTCLIIVASQDCDVLHDDFDVEPVVEILIARPAEKVLESRKNLRHPRELHFNVNGPEGLSPVAVHVNDRAVLDRRLLLSVSPSGHTLAKSDVLRLASLLKRRYGRPALPDSFVARFSNAKKGLGKAVEKHREAVRDVMMTVIPRRELADGEAYALILHVILDDKAVLGKDGGKLQRIKAEIKKSFETPIRDKCSGIDLELVNISLRRDITLEEAEHMIPLQLED